ncbi:hypothetical protein H5410_019995 [Solanum commersonii]|uniref:Uncharacterized protein n=1 Tax=Solanum commersonii TaxID=4109 RepID=A0A9J5Z7V2_SOLCO|nr:hypothetical protein H5410_019995 [Solanum commersonii]
MGHVIHEPVQRSANMEHQLPKTFIGRDMHPSHGVTETYYSTTCLIQRKVDGATAMNSFLTKDGPFRSYFYSLFRRCTSDLGQVLITRDSSVELPLSFLAV